jgi:PDDEXK-like domain of unknown function (DUF3799)
VTAIAEAPAFTAGVYDGMPEAMYHGDPVPGGSLSSTGARKLLPPSCPAKFRYEADNPPPPKDHLEFGSAAHKMVLGVGLDIAVIEAEDWRTKKAQDARKAARAEGKAPLLTAEYEQVMAMAAAIRSHEVASALFSLDRGKPEQSLFWQDAPTGVWRRARIDWLPETWARERLVVADYKTATAADLVNIPKSVASYGYHHQAAWYLDGVRALGLDADPAFVFLFQEKTPPYLITVVQLDAEALRIGRELNREAINLFAACSERGEWPGYSESIEVVSLPAWARRQHEEVSW